MESSRKLALKGFEKWSDHATQLRKASKRGVIMQPSFERLRKQSLSHQEEGEGEKEDEEDDDDVDKKEAPMSLSFAFPFNLF